MPTPQSLGSADGLQFLQGGRAGHLCVSSRTGVMIEASESCRINAGWFYSALGFDGSRQPTVRGPLSGAEAAELEQEQLKTGIAYAAEVAALSAQGTAQRLEHARRRRCRRQRSSRLA